MASSSVATRVPLKNGSRCVTSSKTAGAESVFLADYAVAVAPTDVLDPTDLSPVQQGLFGEVGGIMATAKKVTREKAAYPGSKRAAEEEFGDTLWYFAALCRRVNMPLDEVFAEAARSQGFTEVGAASDLALGALAHVAVPTSRDSVDITLFKLGRAAAALLATPPDRAQMISFAIDYLNALHATKLAFADVARGNIQKARGAFITPLPEDLIDFDATFDIEEQLPRKFEIRINQRGSGRSYLQWNGVFLGDPLTDNISDADGYRFHDVFHLAYAAILHWSPVIRALVKHKRKSVPEFDETQDSGRAIVVEEGLTAWIFSRAKELNFFEGQNRVSLGLLKTIGEFVAGYEVARCPLKLWEQAILEGYTVFRQVRVAEGGWVVGDRARRTITYLPLEAKQ